MSDIEYSEHKSENSFAKNEDNEMDNLDEPYKLMRARTLPFQAY